MPPSSSINPDTRSTSAASRSTSYFANVGLLGIIGLSLLILVNPSRSYTIGLVNISLTSLWLLWKIIVAIYLKHWARTKS